MKIKLSTLYVLLLLLTCSFKAGSEIEDDDRKNNKIDVIHKVTIDNPYESVNWNKSLQVRSTSHIHVTNQASMDRAKKLGYRHLPTSHYYPSTPYYPIDSIRYNQFRVKQDWGVVKTIDGVPQYIEGPIYWNDIIMDEETGWFNSLSADLQQNLPFKVGPLIYTNVPKDIIFSPNAEHHAFANTHGNVHINSVGSLYSSGTFDARNNYKTFWGGGDYSYGAGLDWQDSFKFMLDQLLFEDGGGITINHPTWSGEEALPQSLIEEMLDFDDRVLGIEVLEMGLWSIEMWDKILQTGRRCFGFFVPDWEVDIDAPSPGGFNVLLVDNFTEHDCLKSYRNGAFFGSQFGSEDLVFTNISLKKDRLLIQINSKAKISIITDNEVLSFDDTQRVKYKIPRDKNNQPTIKYVRVEADNGKERILSQPIRFIKSTN